MKKSGMPTFAGPGVASEKLGLVGAGLPLEFVSFGTRTAAGFGAGVETFTHPRLEVEVEALPVSFSTHTRAEPVFGFATFAARPWCGGVAVAGAGAGGLAAGGRGGGGGLGRGSPGGLRLVGGSPGAPVAPPRGGGARGAAGG